MEELYIVNYCNPNCTPFQSMTRLSEQDAFAKAKELSEQFQGTAFGRFADFVNYYPRRIIVEKWLYQSFKEIGGNPQTRHPLYFVLQGSTYLDDWFGNGIVTQLKLSEIDAKDISFTLGDSMSRSNAKSKQVLSKDSLIDRIQAYKNVDSFFEVIRETYTYVEAQLWNDQWINL